MVIAAGYLELDEDDRDAFVADSREFVRIARGTAGCLDFAVSADPVEPTRVNVFECWDSAETLAAVRGDGPDAQSARRIRAMHVRDYDVTG